MITQIGPNAPVAVAAETKAAEQAAKAKPKTEPDARLARVASQFEEVFVRQLLQTSKIGGDKNEEGGGYASMAVDALAQGITAGGGLGIAKQIQAALDHSAAYSHPLKPAKSE